MKDDTLENLDARRGIKDAVLLHGSRRASLLEIRPAMKTKHRDDCSNVFKNYDKTCLRCQELAAGAPVREGRGRAALDHTDALKAYKVVMRKP